jgi:hypothetical protein
MMTATKNVGDVSRFYSLGKYFIHGIFFSLLMSGFLPFFLLVQWIVGYSPVPLTFESLLRLFVLVYIFVGLFIILGAMNSFLANRIWSVETNRSWQEYVGHGIILFALISLVQLPVMFSMDLIVMIQGGLFTDFWRMLQVVVIVSVVLTPIPNGILCRRVATQTNR